MMFSEVLNPRFCETDGLGHINNTVVAQWFEGARDPIFQWFTPDLNMNNWKLILAKTTVEFLAELQYGAKVEIKTYISRIGGSSFDIYQEAWQEGKRSASGTAVMVHYCYQEKSAKKLPDTIKNTMQQHLIELDTIKA